MALCGLLRQWEDNLAGIATRPVLRVVHHLRASKAGLVLCLLAICLTATEMVAAMPDTRRVSVGLRFCIGLWSLSSALYVFQRGVHLSLLLQCVRDVAATASWLEAHTGYKTQVLPATPYEGTFALEIKFKEHYWVSWGIGLISLEALREVARRGVKQVRFYAAYGAYTLLGGTYTIIITYPLWARVFVNIFTVDEKVIAVGRRCLHIAALPFQFYAAACGLTAYYSLMPLILLFYSSLTACLDAIGHGLEDELCRSHWTILHATLIQASMKADSALADILPHFLVVATIMPLFGTLELMNYGSDADLYALATGPILAVVLVPLCMVGDTAAAARQRVARLAYAGPWLGERSATRHLRLGVMQASEGSGGLLRGRLVGRLDRVACANAVRSWFNFLQVG